MRIPKDIAEQYSRMIEVQFWHGNQEQCHAIVDLAFEESDSRRRSKVDRDTSVTQLFDQKIANGLESIGVYFVRDFDDVTKERLSSVAQFGAITISSIEETLEQFGFVLKSTNAEDF